MRMDAGGIGGLLAMVVKDGKAVLLMVVRG
jgi:hypothetical protein